MTWFGACRNRSRGLYSELRGGLFSASQAQRGRGHSTRCVVRIPFARIILRISVATVCVDRALQIKPPISTHRRTMRALVGFVLKKHGLRPFEVFNVQFLVGQLAFVLPAGIMLKIHWSAWSGGSYMEWLGPLGHEDHAQLGWCIRLQGSSSEF